MLWGIEYCRDTGMVQANISLEPKVTILESRGAKHFAIYRCQDINLFEVGLLGLHRRLLFNKSDDYLRDERRYIRPIFALHRQSTRSSVTHTTSLIFHR